jgi:hypothetical protein
MKIKNRNYFIIFFLFIILLLVIYKLYFTTREHYENINKIELKSWWGNDENDKKIFTKIFSHVVDKYDKIEIYTTFAPEPEEKDKTKNNLYVQFSAESYHNNPKKFDINFIPNDEKIENIIKFPFATLNIFNLLSNNNIDTYNEYMNNFTKKRRLETDIKNKKFCLFAVTNGSGSQRNDFFAELSKYQKVDSCGRYMNNMDSSCPGNWWEKEYRDFISQYKFMICFENTSKKNYLTEKLINAYLFGTIPIYWGCSNLEEYVNTDSILYLKKDFTQEDVNKLMDLADKGVPVAERVFGKGHF